MDIDEVVAEMLEADSEEEIAEAYVRVKGMIKSLESAKKILRESLGGLLGEGAEVEVGDRLYGWSGTERTSVQYKSIVQSLEAWMEEYLPDDLSILSQEAVIQAYLDHTNKNTTYDLKEVE